MRGALKISAARAPYRRGGLAFADRSPLTVAVLALTAIQLRQLLEDPAVTVLAGQDEDQFVAIPDLTADVTDEQLQQFINSAPVVDAAAVLANEGLPSPSDELERLRQIDIAWHADQRHLHDQGFQSLDALTSAWAVDRAMLIQLQADGIEQGKLLADAKEMAVALEKLQTEDALRLKRIAELEAELAEAKKPATKPTAKTKVE